MYIYIFDNILNAPPERNLQTQRDTHFDFRNAFEGHIYFGTWIENSVYEFFSY